MSDAPKRESHGPEQSSPLAALQDEIHRTQEAQKSRSVLHWAIDAITSPYHHSSQALDNMEHLANRLNGSVDKPFSAAETADINSAIADNRAARQREQDAFSVTGGVLKTVGMFMPGRLGFWATSAAFDADEVKVEAPRFTDAALGMTKGVASRAVALAMAERGFNPAVMTVGLGISGRFLDTALTGSNYADKTTGELSLSSIGTGVLTVGERTFDPYATGVDLATGALSYGLIKSTGGLLAGNRFKTVAATGFLTGYAGGMTEELSNQRRTGEFDATRLVAYPLARAASSAVASLPGAQRQYVKNWPFEQEAGTRDAEYKLVAIDGADVKRIAAQKTPVDVSVKPVYDGLTLGPAEPLQVGRQKAPIDWISFVSDKMNGRGQTISDSKDQLRFISRPIAAPGETPAPWSMVVRPGFRSIPELFSSQMFYMHHAEAARLTARFAEPATRFLSSGSYSGAIQLSNGAVFKVTKVPAEELKATEDWGRSADDAKLLHPLLYLAGGPHAGSSEHFATYLQEYVKTPTSYEKAEGMMRDMKSRGYQLTDFQNENDDYYPHEQMGTNALGNTVVIDYGARKRIELPTSSRQD